MRNAKTVNIATVVRNEDGTAEVTLETVKEMIQNFRDHLAKQRNLPKNNKVKSYTPFAVIAVQYVRNIIAVTTDLIEQGVIESDPYGFLNATVKSFNRQNDLINLYLIPDAKELLAREHQANLKKAEEAKKKAEETKQKTAKSKTEETPESTVPTLNEELTPDQCALIVSEVGEFEDYILEIFTQSGRKWIFDKKSYTLAYRKKDGNIKYIVIAKKGSWRASAIDFLGKCVEYVRTKYRNLKDRCIGAKQTLQWKWLTFKMKFKKTPQESPVSSHKGTNFDEPLPDAS